MNNKRILFFAPNFFGYDLEIKKKLENMGAIVDFYDDRPSNSTLYKTLIRINPHLAKNKIHKYFSNIVKSNQDKKYDYVFFIKCEAALAGDLKLLKKTFSEATFVLYLFDSISNIKYFDIKEKYFDTIFSFDLEDVKRIERMKFLPLFYLDAYKQNITTNVSYRYDLSFIGTGHSDRPKIINLLRKELEQQNKSYYFQLYIPSKTILYAKILTNSHFRDLYKNKCITLNKIEVSKVSQVMNESRCILDIQHPRQSGLTMRTIELVGMKKKFMTTNNYIRQYDFYDPNNIMVIERNHPHFNGEVLIREYKPISKEIYDSYSINQWIIKIFGLNK
ncbi:CgeB family protein [Beduini massiliensis]|uniref:hypothetical protein n=1 Tax=Beduini massiliensis TaxID=1585974 RepID=UPI00059AA571|nr:hypothetical protein [Beduini massiliensis]